MKNKELILNNDVNEEILYQELLQEDKEITADMVNSYVKCAKHVKDLKSGILTFSDNPESKGS